MYSASQDLLASISGESPSSLEPAMPPVLPGDEDEIWAKRGTDYVRLRIGEIERVESERDYVHIHNGERAYLLRATLKSVHERLGMERYLRVRRSAIVRIDQILAIRDLGYGDIRILLRSGSTMRVGRTYLKPIRQRVKLWRG